MRIRMDAPLPLAGRYRFLRRLRGTSSGVIWLASDSVAGRTVVVSSVTSTRVAGLKAAVGLRHAHLATLLDLFEDISPGQIPGRVALRPGMALVVAEHVAGQTLHERLEQGPLTPQRAVQIVAKLASALATLHASGGVHGALSPRSVVVARNDGGVVPILTNLRAAANGAYCSPERVRGTGPSAQDDAWALHATLFAALTGDSPYHGKTREELASAILSGSVPRLLDHGIHDPDLERIVQRGLAPERGSRLVSVAELEHNLAAWVSARPGDVPDRVSAAPPLAGTIAPPPIDDEDVAEGHRTVALASPVANGHLPEDEQDEEEDLETVQLDASAMLMRAAMSKHGSPLGDPDDPSLGDQLPTEVMSGELLDEMVDQVRAEAAKARAPMLSETRSMEVAVDDFMPEVRAEDVDDGATSEHGSDDAFVGPPEPRQQQAEIEAEAQPQAWPPAPQHSVPGFGGDVPGMAELAQPDDGHGPAGPQKGWGPAEPTPPHLDPQVVLSQVSREPDPEAFVDPAAVRSEEEQAPAPRKKRSLAFVIFAGLLLTILAAVVSFVVAVVATGGNVPAPIASIFGRYGVPVAAESPPTASTAPPVAPMAPPASSAAAPPDAEPPASDAAAAVDAASSAAAVVADAGTGNGTSEALSEEALQTCVESFFPERTFIRKVPFEYVCKNENPRKSAIMLHQQLVRGGAGTVTTGMKLWSSLSWYELPVVAMIHAHCCPGAPSLELPDPGEPCGSMTQALQDATRGTCTDEGANKRAEQYADAVLCLFRHERPRPYRYRGVIRAHQRIAFEELLKQLPEERCSK